MKLLVTGGGSGGHTLPVLPVVQKLKNEVKKAGLSDLEIVWVGSKYGPEQDIATRLGIKYYGVSTGKLRRYFSWENFTDLLRVPLGTIQSLHILNKEKPDFIFSKGGYVSLPITLANIIKRKPLVIHESDIRPGLATKISSPFAKTICLTFEKTKEFFKGKNTKVTGTPVRLDILDGDIKIAEKITGLNKSLPVLLIMGGSQGAMAINKVVWESLPELTKFCNVLHQCGKDKIDIPENIKNLKDVQSRYRSYEFFDEELKDIYAISDIVLTRAGCNQLSELAAVGKPAIAVPLPGSAGNHQYENAKLFEKSTALILIPQNKLTSKSLVENVRNLINQPEERNKLSENIKKFAKLDATDLVAKEIIKVIDIS